MKSVAFVKPVEDLDLALSLVRSIDPTLVVVFMAQPLFKDKAVVERLTSGLANLQIIGCSTCGEISSQGLHENAIGFLSIRFDATTVRLAKQQVKEASDSEAAGKSIAEQLDAPDLKSIFVLGPGTNINGSAMVRGLYDRLSPEVVVTGGLAGDDVRFQETYTLLGDFVSNDHIVAFGLYGDAVEVTAGSEGGWRPFGPARLVTKAEGHILYELDGHPVMELYDEYLGTTDRYDPASRLSYPFAILREDRSNAGLIRSALGIDRTNNSLILAGDLPEGSHVCLMHADTDGLIQGAAQAATESIRIHKARHELGVAIMVSCVGRRLVMSIDTDEEIEAVRDSFDDGMTISGFYAYGEICPFAKGKRPELHNQTMTVTFITEKLSS